MQLMMPIGVFFAMPNKKNELWKIKISARY